jgi:gamma-glutamyltranspeptidase
VTSRGGVELVLGSPGGERGLAAIVQVIVRALDLHDPLGRAVLARRLHLVEALEGGPPRVYLEGVVWSDTASAREVDGIWGGQLPVRAVERGLALGERDLGPVVLGLDPWFGGVNAVAREADGWAAAGDERRDGAGGVLVDGSFSLQGEPGGVTSTAPPPRVPPEDPAAGNPPDPAGTP